jgi:uncharacterized protein (TIGR02453 family)
VAFRGWPVEAIEFYEGLEADNSKTYWHAHKQEFEELVRRPMLELLAELEPEFGTAKVFRPNRDVRFSADKSPYKTRIYASLERGGYVQFSADGLAAGCGYWMVEPDQLDRYRRAVADDTSGAELVAIVYRIVAKGIEVTARESLKTAPRGYPKDHPRIELLRNKGLITWREWPAGAWLGTAKAKDRVVEFLRTSAPLQAWLDARVGPSEQHLGDRGRGAGRT